MTTLPPTAPRDVHSGRRAGPPYLLLGDVACEVCGLIAVAFWPGRHVHHRDGTVCVIATGQRAGTAPADLERTAP